MSKRRAADPDLDLRVSPRVPAPVAPHLRQVIGFVRWRAQAAPFPDVSLPAFEEGVATRCRVRIAMRRAIAESVNDVRSRS